MSATLPLLTPDVPAHETFTDPKAAVARLQEIYQIATKFLCGYFAGAISGEMPDKRYRAFYPEIRLTTTSHTKADSRLSFGHVAEPGEYATTVTPPSPARICLRIIWNNRLAC